MKFLFEGYWHHKNKNGILLMINEGMDVDFSYNPNTIYDWIINLSEFKKYDNHKGGLIYGPQILFPKINTNDIPNKDGNTYCNLLSPWLVNLMNTIHVDVKCLALPFAVDINKFSPSKKDGLPVIYFKHVNKEWLDEVLNHLDTKFIVFDYDKKYSEESFKEAISRAPYTIWIGRHESQGFAFQETLSCDTPIFVVDIKSLRDEVVPNRKTAWDDYLPDHKLPATAASYFDDRCGMISNINTWFDDFQIFKSRLNEYSPRSFIIENLSPKACFQTWIKTLSNI